MVIVNISQSRVFTPPPEGNGRYFYSTDGNTFGQSIAYDESTDEIYISGQVTGTGQGLLGGGDDIYIAKYNSSLVLQWQRIFGTTTSSEARPEGIAAGNGNVYIGFSGTNAGSPTGLGVNIAKISSAGSLQWNKRYNSDASPDFGEINQLTLDSSGDLLAVGNTSVVGEGSSEILIFKIDPSDGSVTFTRSLGSTTIDTVKGLTVDSSDNIILAGYTRDVPAGTQGTLVAKYNTSGTLQWQQILYGTSGVHTLFGVDVDSNDNIYAVGQFRATDQMGLLIKYNSSGTLQFQVTLDSESESGDNLGHIGIDDNDNIYVSGLLKGATAVSSFLVAGYDTSGTLQFQNMLDAVSDATAVISPNTQTTGSLATAGGKVFNVGSTDVFANIQRAIVFEVDPAGGTEWSQIGTDHEYVTTSPSMTASTSSLTSAAGSLVSSSQTFTAFDTGYDFSTPTLTDAAMS